MDNNYVKYSLILDLDHTLISAHTDIIDDEIKPILNVDLEKNYWIYARPFLYEFLKIVSKHFDVYSYSAGHKDYTDRIIDHLELTIGKKIFKDRFSRDHCIIYRKSQFRYVFWKDISKLGFSINNTIVIDDNPQLYRDQSNVIKIKPWIRTHKNDNSLENLLPFLLLLTDNSNICHYIQQHNRIYIKRNKYI